MEFKTVSITKAQSGDAYLFILDGTGRPQTYKLTAHTTIARDSSTADADIRLRSRFVSSNKHGEFILYNNEYYYRDNNSTNGTVVNGVLIRNDTRVIPLTAGDILKVNASQEYPKESVIMIFAKNSAAEEFSWRTFTPDEGCMQFNIGRAGADSPNRVVVESPEISRNQCVFIRSGNGWAVENQSITNPTMLNGEVLTGIERLVPPAVLQCGLEYIIFDGEAFHIQTKSVASGAEVLEDGGLQIRIDQRTVLVRDKVKSLFGNSEFNFKSLVVGKKKNLLKDINIDIRHGEFVLILGGSGAGKTTFMNAVMAYEKADGKVTVDDVDIYNNYKQVKKLVGFVPQQNLVRDKDIVYDTLYDAARMKADISDADTLNLQVEKTLKLFGLTAQKDKLVSALSGGQIRRLSIAIEYIGNPKLFFLDEPDSGLDYATTRVLLESLRNVADEGKIVMIISHAPDRGRDIYDKVLVLAKSEKENCGRLAFYGSPDDACDFFEVSSLEQIMTKINSRDEGGEGRSDYYINLFEKQSK